MHPWRRRNTSLITHRVKTMREQRENGTEDPARIRGLILDKYGTYTAFAEKVNVSRSFLSRILLGHAQIPTIRLMDFAAALDIEYSDMPRYFRKEEL